MSVIHFPFEKVTNKTMADTLRHFAHLIDNGQKPAFVFAGTIDKIDIFSMASGIGIFEAGLSATLNNQVLNCNSINQNADKIDWLND